MEDNGNFEKGQDDGFTQANTYQNTQQNLAQMHSQSTESASGFAIAGMICGILSIVCCCAWYICFNRPGTGNRFINFCFLSRQRHFINEP